jgi:trimeric autotransporter adhesin
MRQSVTRSLFCVFAALTLLAPAAPVRALSDPMLVKNLGPGASQPGWFARFDGAVYFSATDGNKGYELWRTKGTASSTVRVKDIYDGAVSSNPTKLTRVGDTLFFVARDARGYELWKTKGTRRSTRLVENINAGPDESDPLDLVNVGGTLFFYATDGQHGYELWKSRGTRRSTKMVKNINPGGSSASLDEDDKAISNGLANFNGTLVLRANDGEHGLELWKSDGSRQGTRLVKDIDHASVNGAQPYGFTPRGDIFIFGAYDADHGGELWKSRGTRRSTELVKNIAPGNVTSDPSGFTRFDGKVFFSARSDGSDLELWKTRGTRSSTTLVKDIDPLGSGAPYDFEKAGDRLFFSAETSDFGRELWKTRGSPASTKMVKDINTDAPSSNPSFLTNVNGRLFFSAWQETQQAEVWVSNGTADGTDRFVVNPSGSGDPQDFIGFKDRVIFSADDGMHGRELWKMNL